MDQQPSLLCPVCHYPIKQEYYFCPNCGKNLKPAPLSTSLEKQIGVYLLSVFVPPFGLIPSIRYLTQKDEKSKMVGMVALLLTVLSTVITTYYTFQFVSGFTKTVDQQLNSQSLY